MSDTQVIFQSIGLLFVLAVAGFIVFFLGREAIRAIVRGIRAFIAGARPVPVIPQSTPELPMPEYKPEAAIGWLKSELIDLPGETTAAFVAIAEGIIREKPRFIESQTHIPTHEEKDAYRSDLIDGGMKKARTLVAEYRKFHKRLPSQQTEGQVFKTDSARPSTEVIDALYTLFRAVPGQYSDRHAYAIDQEAHGETKGIVDLNAISARDPDYLLQIVTQSPFQALLSTIQATVSVPSRSRFEGGAFILGPPGSGKTTLIELLATTDMKDAHASVFVLDSQGKLIPDLASLADFQDRIILVEPGQVAINPFDIKGEQGVDLITFILGALGGEGAELTSKQMSFYRPCVRLLLEVPGATFLDFYKLLQPRGLFAYAEHIPKLSQTMQLFFENEFDNPKAHAATKDELMWRLRPITEDPVYERMFCTRHTKLDLFRELDSRKIILVDTNKQELGPVRSALFGRVFVALLYRAALQRKGDNHPPVYAYIDEAHEYLQDDQIADMLDEVRKRKIAITLATQRLDKIRSRNMLSALMTTAVKYVRAGNDADAHSLAREMKAPAEMLSSLSPRTFALSVRDVTKEAVPIVVPDFDIKRDFKQGSLAVLRERTRQLYGPSDQKPEPPPSAPKPRKPRSKKVDTAPKEW